MHESQVPFQQIHEPMKEMDSNCKDKESNTFAMEVFDDPFDAFHPTLSDSSVQHDKLSTCPLFTLARELRDIIYTDLIATGHVKLAQTSKAFATEFMELIGKKGICRLTTNETKDPWLTHYPKLGKPLADTIQYLDLRLVTDMIKGKAYSGDGRLEKIFGDPSVPRKSCHVIVEEHLPLHGSAQQYQLSRSSPLSRLTRYVRPLTSLGGFQTLTVKVRCKMYVKEEGPLTLQQAIHVAHSYEMAHWVLAGALRGTLGDPVTWNKDDPATRYLEFHPRAYREAMAREGKVVRLDKALF